MKDFISDFLRHGDSDAISKHLLISDLISPEETCNVLYDYISETISGYTYEIFEYVFIVERSPVGHDWRIRCNNEIVTVINPGTSYIRDIAQMLIKLLNKEKQQQQ